MNLSLSGKMQAAGSQPAVRLCETDAPFLPPDAGSGPLALAVITGIEGPSYRPLGAMMAIDAAGQAWGNLSSGCIERDVILHARQALADGQARQLRYGKGSPFQDLALPCGGGLDILIQPQPDRVALRQAASHLAMRQDARLTIGPLSLHILPRLRVAIFGKGPEARGFAALSQAAGFLVELFSPDAETLSGAASGHLIARPEWPADLAPDARTAVALFFHDHDWEPPLLRAALSSAAFYIGAQGSLRAHQSRCEALSALGVSRDQIDRIAAPFGLIPSARDPQTLAASVLAQILERARLQ